jgi:hypothetical protein
MGELQKKLQRVEAIQRFLATIFKNTGQGSSLHVSGQWLLMMQMY